MALPSSGTITLAQVNVELQKSSTAQISLNDADVRALAGVPSGAISMSNLYGKSRFIIASGGTETTYSSGGATYKVHTFTSGGTLTVSNAGTSGFNSIDYLIVAGGGSGGKGWYSSYEFTGGGGGGAGGVLASSTTQAAGSYGVSVGSGGSSQSGLGNGNNGGNSSIFGLTAIGGGGGGIEAGASGGSGGRYALI